MLQMLVGLSLLALAGCGGSKHGTTTATTSTASSTTTSTVTPEAHAGPADEWPTYHRNSARTGAGPLGPPLGRATKQWSSAVDGPVYAEPLVVRGRVIVATENDSVYAFAAATGRQLWQAHLATPVSGGDLPCGNIDLSGITGTPVVDPTRRVVFAVTFQRFEHRLVALDLGSGRVRWQRPIDPPGADPRTHQQRAALALSHGRVYVAYGGLFGDCGDYHGSIVGAAASRPTGGLVSYRVPTAREAGIWAPSGPAVNDAGNVFVATGNGASTSTFDFGNAVIRLTPTLQQSGFFAPRNAPELAASDLDLGSTGPILLPGSRVFIIGKTGTGYLLSARNLGGIGHPLGERSICGAAFGGNAYARGTIYVPCTDGIVAVSAAGLGTLWKQSAASLPPIIAGPGLWAIGGQTLYQLDPQTGRVRFSAPIGEPAHFATPAAADGRVFVAAGSRVYAFG
jgi:outer membrane protein assembly factor BamB